MKSFRIKRPKIRMVTPSRQSLRALADRAPVLEAFAERTVKQAANRLRPGFTWMYVLRRRLATATVAALTAWLFVHVVFGANGMVVYRQKKAEYQSLEKEINGLQKDNTRYNAEIKALKGDPETIEREAREQLHYTRPGEVVYVAPAPAGPAQPPSTDAARK
jgi:cell division protein FtsB